MIGRFHLCVVMTLSLCITHAASSLPDNCVLTSASFGPGDISLLLLGGRPICFSTSYAISAAQVREAICGNSVTAVAYPVPASSVVLEAAQRPVFVTDLCFDVEIPYSCTPLSICSQVASVGDCSQLTAVNCSAVPVVQGIPQGLPSSCAAAKDLRPAVLVNITPTPQLEAGYVCAATLSIPGALLLCRSLGLPGPATVTEGPEVDPSTIYYTNFSCPESATDISGCSYTLSLTQAMCTQPAVIQCGKPPCRFQPTDVYGAFCERTSTGSRRRMLYVQQNSSSRCMEVVYSPNVLSVAGLIDYAHEVTYVPNQTDSIYPMYLSDAQCDMVTGLFAQPFLDAENATIDTYYSLSINNATSAAHENIVFDGCVACPTTAPVGFYCGGLTGGLFQLSSTPAGDMISIWRDMYERNQVVCMNARVTFLPDTEDSSRCRIFFNDSCPGYSDAERRLYFDGFTQSIAAVLPPPASTVLAFYSVCPEPPPSVCPPVYAPLTNLSICGISLYDGSRTARITFTSESTLDYVISYGSAVAAACQNVQYAFSPVSVGCTLVIPDMVSLGSTCSRTSPWWGQFQLLAAAVMSAAEPPALLLNLLNDTMTFSMCRSCPDYFEQQYCGSDGATALYLRPDGTFLLSDSSTQGGTEGRFHASSVPQCLITLNTTLTLPFLMPKDMFTFCLLETVDGVASCDSVPEKQKIVFRQCLLPPTLPLEDYCSSSMHLRLSLLSPMRAIMTDELTQFSLAVPYAVLAKNRSFVINRWNLVSSMMTGLKGAAPLQVVFQPSTKSFLWYFGDGYQYMSAAECRPPTLLTVLLHSLNATMVVGFALLVIVVNARSRRSNKAQQATDVTTADVAYDPSESETGEEMPEK